MEDRQNNNNNRWTPELVEQKLFLTFSQGKDVSGSLPPTPQWNGGSSNKSSSGIFELPDSANLLFKFVENGPVATGNALRANNNSNATTPKKGPMGMLSSVNTPTSKGVSKPGSAAASAVPQRTPKAGNKVENGGAPGLPRTPKGKSEPNPRKDIAVDKENQDRENSTAVAKKQQHIDPTPTSPNGGKPAPVPKLVQGGSMQPPAKIKWPGHVPTNAELKGESRSKLVKYTTARVQGQDGVDPDLIFAAPDGEFPLTAIFANNPQGLAKAKTPRGNSGDWENDNFTEKEESRYKAEMKFRYLGPSQAKGLFHRSLV